MIARNVADLPEAFAEIAADLRNQYSIGYVPNDSAHDGEWRKIDVETPGRALDVTALGGIYGQTGAEAP